ncbi:Ger(x)C family spore germination C-terminal domain-containing protein [Amphibacillus sp. MSJ-3]|uniref:Ger(x)C family spore germination protein n=1 Tax=Amphibacillus sp. MSJ-3 TaxID=2841505 RepID=UPI0020A168E0|nr:Ger(x)C family spore germination C-terminal domain-containing protein [Amphibacillus sp. MSJ-3]
MDKWIKSTVLIVLLIILSSCQDMIEVEKESFVIAIGMDVTDQEGIYEFTFQIANPNIASPMTADPNGAPDEILTVLGADIMTAKDKADAIVTKRISLDHTAIFVISEELARSGDLLRVIQPGTRTSHMRHDIQIIVSKEKAETFLNNNNPIFEQKPYKYFQYKITQTKETGIIPYADLHRLLQITEGDADLFLAIYATTIHDEEEIEKSEDQYLAGELLQKGGDKTQFMGSAVFKNGKMIDLLTAQETRIANLLDRTVPLNNILVTYTDPIKPEFYISGNYIQTKNPDIKIDYDAKANHATIDVTVLFEFEILAIPSLISYAENNEHKEILEKHLVETNTQLAKKFIEKTQEEYRSDPFYWSLYIRKYFKDVPSYEKADWHNNIYPNAEVNIKYELKRLQFGKTMSDTNLSEVRD